MQATFKTSFKVNFNYVYRGTWKQVPSEVRGSVSLGAGDTHSCELHDSKDAGDPETVSSECPRPPLFNQYGV